MGIVDDVKDAARKATNSVVDTAEAMVGMPKSPKELAKRLVEHLNHQEYTKVAEILTEEAKKYVAKLGLDDIGPVNSKLEDFQDHLTKLAGSFERNDYRQISTKLKEFKNSVPSQVGPVSDVFTTIKSFLDKIIETTEEYARQGVNGVNEHVDFSKLQEVFEEHFNKIIKK